MTTPALRTTSTDLVLPHHTLRESTWGPLLVSQSTSPRVRLRSDRFAHLDMTHYHIDMPSTGYMFLWNYVGVESLGLTEEDLEGFYSDDAGL
jgi:hypothetical protein